MPLFSWLFGVLPALWATSFPASINFNNLFTYSLQFPTQITILIAHPISIEHLHLYLPFLCSTTLNTTIHLLVTLHAFSQNKTTRLVIQMKAKIITFFNSNKKMPLYIRHSCCIKIPQFQPKSTPFIHLRHHSSTHFSITQNLSNPYFISIFTFPINLFQLFIPVTPFFHILLHKKKATPRSVTSSFPFISKREAMNIFY